MLLREKGERKLVVVVLCCRERETELAAAAAGAAVGALLLRGGAGILEFCSLAFRMCNFMSLLPSVVIFLGIEVNLHDSIWEPAVCLAYLNCIRR